MYNIRNLKIKSKKDYLKTGARVKHLTTIREDLFKNIDNFSIKTKTPKSKMLDVMIYLSFNDKEVNEKFIKLLKEY